MRNPINPPWNDRRVEALMRQQANEHEHLMTNYHAEMQTLRDSLKLALEKFDSLFQQCEQELKEKTSSLNEQILDLKNKVRAHEILSSDQSQTTKSLYQQIHDFHLAYVTREEMKVLKEYHNSKFKDCSDNQINSLQNLQREIKEELTEIKDQLRNLREETQETCRNLDRKVDENYLLLKMDKEGVLKEVRIFEKTIFIIEKKLENIYTLIDRINKRGEKCPKQD